MDTIHCLIVITTGNLALCRFYSKHLALRKSSKKTEYAEALNSTAISHVEIKAKEEGVYGKRYEEQV